MAADYVIKSNCIFDSCGDKPFDGFIAVKGDRIFHVGKENESMETYIGNSTELFIYEDKLVMPGICESHAHVFYGALEVEGANVAESVSEENAAEMIFEHEK